MRYAATGTLAQHAAVLPTP